MSAIQAIIISHKNDSAKIKGWTEFMRQYVSYFNRQILADVTPVYLINKSELKCTFLKDIHWVVQTLCNTVYMYISYRPCVATSVLHCAHHQLLVFSTCVSLENCK